MRSRFLAYLAAIGLVFCTVIPPMPALADYPLVTATGTLTPANTTALLAPLSGQSSCAVEIQSNTGETLNFEGIVNTNWVAVPGVTPDQTVTTSTTTAATGTYIVNCASLIAFRVRASGTGTAVLNLTASGGVGRVLGAGVNGGKTTVAGSGPITVTNAGNTATIGLVNPLPIANGGTNNTAFTSNQCIQFDGTKLATTGFACGSGSGTVASVSGTAPITSSGGSAPTIACPTCATSVTAGSSNVSVATPSAGVFSISVATSAPQATSTPVSVVAGNSNVTVATPSAGVFSVSVTTPTPAPAGVTAVTGSGNIQSSGGTTPNITTTNSVTFPGSVTAGSGNFPIVNSGTPGGSTGTGLFQNSQFGQSYIFSCPTGIGSICQAGGVYGSLFDMAYSNNNQALVAIDGVGNLGTFGSLSSGQLTAGQCLTATTNGKIITTGAACAAAATPTSVTAGSPNVTVATPTAGSFVVSVATQSPAPTASPVAVQAGSNVTVATPSAGVFVVSAITPTPAPTGSPVSVTAGTANVSVATPSAGSFVISVTTAAPGATSTPVSVTAGTGIAVATPSAGVFQVSNTGVLTTTASGNLASTGGQNPAISLTATPTFTSITDTGLTAGNCVQALTGGLLGTISKACVTSITAGQNITVATPAPGQYVVSETVTPGPAATPVSVQAGANVTVATPAAGVFVVAAATAIPVAVQAGQNISVATPSAGVYVVSETVTPGPATTPVSVQAGSGISIATPSAGVFVVTNTALGSASATAPIVLFTAGPNANFSCPTCVTSVTASGNLASTGGTTPAISISNTPTFSGSVTSPAGYINTVVSGTAGGSTGTGIFQYSSLGQSYIFSCPTGLGAICQTAGVYGSLFSMDYQSNPQSLVAIDGNGNLGTFGSLSSAQLTAGQCLTATTNGKITTTGAACSSATGTVTGVTGVAPITVTAGATPAVSCPTCVTSVTAGSNIVTGGTATAPTVAVTAAPTFTGNVTAANVIHSTFTTTAACINSTATKTLAQSQNGCDFTNINGVATTGTAHTEIFTGVTQAVLASNTLTFKNAFTTAPYCSATQSAAGLAAVGGPTGYAITTTTTTVTVVNDTGAAQTTSVMCVGI